MAPEDTSFIPTSSQTALSQTRGSALNNAISSGDPRTADLRTIFQDQDTEKGGWWCRPCKESGKGEDAFFKGSISSRRQHIARFHAQLYQELCLNAGVKPHERAVSRNYRPTAQTRAPTAQGPTTSTVSSTTSQSFAGQPNTLSMLIENLIRSHEVAVTGSLQNENRSLQSDLNQLLILIGNLESEKREIERLCAEAEQENTLLIAANRSLEDDTSKLEDENGTLFAEKEMAAQTILERDAEIQKYKQDLDECRADCAKAFAERNFLFSGFTKTIEDYNAITGAPGKTVLSASADTSKSFWSSHSHQDKVLGSSHTYTY